METDPTVRALALLELLRPGGEWTAAELADRLGVTPRTVRRDVSRLRRLDFPIATRPGPGSRYRLEATDRVPPQLFTDDEVTALVAGLRLVRVWLPADDVAASALAKLEHALPRHVQQRAAAMTLVTEVLEQPGAAVPAAVVGLIADTVAAGGRVRFGYTDQHGTTTERLVQPYRHVLRDGRWYLVGFDLDRDDWRLYRLDRLTGLRRVAGTFAPREFPSPSIEQWFATDFGRLPPAS